ncbi:patatin-like phospholipase family protein [Myxococcota bacterium]
MRIASLLVALVLSGCGSTPQSTPALPASVSPEPEKTADPPAEPSGQEEPAPPEKEPPRIALVLGGGGARGFAHVGVLRVLEQEKIPIDLIVGTSVGSLIGALYAADPNTFELEWKAFQIEQDDLFDFSLFAAKTGPVKGEAIQEFIRKNAKLLQIEDFKIRYIAVAADLNTGELVKFTRGSVVAAVRASVSIPGVFTPARIGNRTLVDGGVVANVAVDVAHDAGADIVIVSNITQNVVDHDVEDVVSVILQSINIMMSKMASYEIGKADVVITPKIGDVGTLDFSQKKRCMREGIAATKMQIPAIREAIAQYYADRGGEPVASPD